MLVGGSNVLVERIAKKGGYVFSGERLGNRLVRESFSIDLADAVGTHIIGILWQKPIVRYENPSFCQVILVRDRQEIDGGWNTQISEMQYVGNDFLYGGLWGG